MFYLVLGLRLLDDAQDQALIIPAELSRYKHWEAAKLTSIGKVVSRHINKQQCDGLPIIVSSRQKTNGWVLTLDREQIEFLPGLKEARDKLDALMLPVFDVNLDWLNMAVRALILLHQGYTEEAHEMACLGYSRSGSALERDVSKLLIHRAAARATVSPCVDSFDVEVQHDAISPSLAIRLASLQAFSEPYEYAESELTKLKKLHHVLFATSDIAGLGVVFNTMSVLAKRSGTPDEGARFATRAIVYSLISGDLPTLQAAIFNLGHSLTLMSDEVMAYPPEKILDLFEMDRAISSGLGIGNDSAQAEIVAANYSMKLGLISRAWEYLDRAMPILEKSASDFDNGGFFRVRAKVRCKEVLMNSGKLDSVTIKQAKNDMRKAQKCFMAGGHGVSNVQKELSLLENGKAPFLK
ncbi:MAG: hypothetical protein H6981_14745 [Gammaproteobacteria bacterium]|nr:hypothetical protein [Gammaproteobacteria bacterium]MCP5138042.1 hypothetical protein [Gammaproteobacteria bacterium]